MAGSAIIHEARVCVVRECRQEACSRVTVTTVRVGVRVGAGRGVNKAGCLANSDSAVMASFACSDDACVIEAAVRRQFQEADGIVAAIAFGTCW